MNKIEALKQALEGATPGEWKPCRAYEDFHGPYSEIDEDERAVYEACPFVSIENPLGYVTTNHDLFAFRGTDAQLIALMKNTLPDLLEAVRALEHMRTSFDELRNGWPQRELHESPQVTMDRADATLIKLRGEL